MARLARIVLPGVPHHVTQRGNRREHVFFEDGDYALYLDLLAEASARAGVAIQREPASKVRIAMDRAVRTHFSTRFFAIHSRRSRVGGKGVRPPR